MKLYISPLRASTITFKERNNVKKLIILALAILSIVLLASCGEHTHVSEVIPRQEPTCTQVGYSEWEKCKDCGEVLVAKRELPASHKEKVSLEVKATCTKFKLTTP